jgi:hypothetical protein
MRSNSNKHPRHSYQDSPVYWFAILDRAIEARNPEAAANATRELLRLGVDVRFFAPRGTHRG